MILFDILYIQNIKIIKFITKAMENWKVELSVGRQTRVKEKNPKRYLPGRRTVIIAICYRNDATQLYTWELPRELHI